MSEGGAFMGVDYRRYQLTWKDWIEYILRIGAKGLVIGYLFYDSLKMCVICIPFFIVDYREFKKEKLQKQKRELTNQFKDMMEALVTSLTAGYSLERAFSDAKRDLSFIYDDNAIIFRELDEIISGLKVNIPIEKLLSDFGNRSGVEDIENFANVVNSAKRSGGNLIRIIEKTVRSISDKISVEEEMETMISAKKLEEKIMMVMPYGILLYLRAGNGGFLDVLYHNAIGIFLMTVFLIGVYIANIWASKIMDISV